MTDWNDPADRARLIQEVGPDEYNRLFEEHFASIAAEHGGHAIYPVRSRFGVLYVVGGTREAFPTVEQAIIYATANPVSRPVGDST